MSWLPDVWVLAALASVGATCGALGGFAMLRRQSLLSDTLAHAALPGVCLAYVLTGSKEPLVLLAGAFAAGLAGVLWVLGILRGSRLKQDAALGIVLATFFGVGVVLLTLLQNRPDAGQAGLDHFIYGQAAYLTRGHVAVMLFFGLLVLAMLALFYKEFKLLSFDGDYASTLGFRRGLLEICLSVLIVTAVMISLRATGVVLTVALLIAPAAAARQWTHRLGTMLFLAAAIGVASALGGAMWSQNQEHTPTGPAVVLVASGLLVLSLLWAPRRGLYWGWQRLRRHRRQIRRENLLADFYRLGERRRDWQQDYSAEELAGVRRQKPREVRAILRELEQSGAASSDGRLWRLTSAGIAEAAKVVRNHRLWELYLARRLDLAADHVHRDAEEMEHALSAEVVGELMTALENPDLDPHGHPIPRAVKLLDQ